MKLLSFDWPSDHYAFRLSNLGSRVCSNRFEWFKQEACYVRIFLGSQSVVVFQKEIIIYYQINSLNHYIPFKSNNKFIYNFVYNFQNSNLIFLKKYNKNKFGNKTTGLPLYLLLGKSNLQTEIFFDFACTSQVLHTYLITTHFVEICLLSVNFKVLWHWEKFIFDFVSFHHVNI